MYSKIVWGYVLVLTLLDISLNKKLTAQGKSHDVTVHDSLVEGITIQEWGKDVDGSGSGRRSAGSALSLSPPSLEFGRAALATAHALTVTVTNTANTTVHLASVAGTTPDFHASFFEAKTLAPQANTTFSVVYVGRREGPVAAHLYIHTSLGVHKYPVSATGVASAWGVWPLVGLRVPANATAEPLLTLTNPTGHTVQVSEVYSSASWLGLRLPDGAGRAPRAAWQLPPRAERPLVRLQARPHHHHHALTAYVRIKGTLSNGEPLSLVVCVEAKQVAAGEFLEPWQLRLRARGHADPPLVMDISAGNSLDHGVSLEAAVWAAQCGAEPVAPPAPPDPADTTARDDPTAPIDPSAPAAANGQPDKATANGNGVKSDGVHVSLLRTHLDPFQELTPTAQLTLDYSTMWSSYAAGAEDGGVEGGEAWCGGWVRVGRAALPYSVRLLRGTLRLLPDALHLVTANEEEALKQHEINVQNEFSMPVHITHVEAGPEIDEHFEWSTLTPLVVGGGKTAMVARLRLRVPPPAGEPLNTSLVLHTNVTSYTLPVYVYSGQIYLVWEWPNSSDGELRLGAVGTSSTRRVALRLHNPAPAPLCLAELRADLPGAQLALDACNHLRHVPDAHSCRCVPAGGRALAWLTVVAPAREGAVRGSVRLSARAPSASSAPLAHSRASVSLHAHRGRLHALPLHLPQVAPYVPSSCPLTVESSMALRMRVLHVTYAELDPALTYEAPEDAELGPGRQAAGTVHYEAERLCEPNCYTGLDLATPEGMAWVRRSIEPSAESLQQDAALHAERYAEFTRHAQRAHNVSLYLHTTQVVQVGARGTVSWWWASLGARAEGGAGLAGVGAARSWRLRARNPASQPLLLQPVLAAPLTEPLAGSTEAPLCATETCTFSPESFRLEEWRATRGTVRPWSEMSQDRLPEQSVDQSVNTSQRWMPPLLLSPGAEVELKLVFAPKEALALSAFLYLRNNLTIIESVQLTGRGAVPSFELGGRRPDSGAPFVFEVAACGSRRGAIRRRVVARNCGRVAVRLRDWRLPGGGCTARGFRLQPCAPLTLAPNESRALHLHFAPDYMLARVSATLQLLTDTGRATFTLTAVTPAASLGACAASLPRPPWEPLLRGAGTVLSLVALAMVLAAAALDAERELRRARAARAARHAHSHAPTRRALDLRDAARAPAPTPTAPTQPSRRAPARRRRARPRPPELDPQAERRAFERWRAEMLRRASGDDSRSSEDAERDAEPAPDTPPEPQDPPPPAADGYEADPETEDRPQGSGDEDAASTGSGTPSASSSSTPTVEDHDADEADDDAEADADVEADADEPEPERASATPPAAETPTTGRGSRARHTGDATRRSERSRTGADDSGGRTRSAAAKHHARKDKLAKRRERPPADPPQHTPRAQDGRAGGALRWGASWSSVVARGGAAPGSTPTTPGTGTSTAGAPLAPIGSDVRRRTDPPTTTPGVVAPGASVTGASGAGDHSLFYFNGDAAHSEFAWCAPPVAERPAFAPVRDYLEEPGAVGSGAFRSASAAWGATLEPRPTPAAAAWLWGAGGTAVGTGAPASGTEVRPPPGFGAPPRPARVYDPFRSLSAIWAPGARDWGADANDRQHN